MNNNRKNAMASRRRPASRQRSPAPQRLHAHEDAPPSRRSSERLADRVGAGSNERELHKDPHERSRRSKHSNKRGKAADEDLQVNSGSWQTEGQPKRTLPASSPKKAAADPTPKSEVIKDSFKSPKKRSSPSPQRVRLKSRATTSTSRNESSPAAPEHELRRSERSTVQTALATRTRDQATRRSIEVAVEEDTRKRANQHQWGSQSQEETELLTERSRWRLAYFVLCLGNSIVAVVLFILVLRLVWYAEANWLTGFVSRGKNASEVSEGQASARVYCLDAGACRDAYASILRESIDADADPCHNFYNYACGGWLRNHEESTALTAWRQYANDAIEQLRLARVSARVRGESVAQAAHFLDTCLQVGRKPESGTNTEVDIKEVFAEAGLRWPERSEHSDLINSLFFMARRVALPVFFDVDSGYTKAELGTIFFRLDTTFQKTTSRLVDLLKKGSLSRFVRLLYRAFAVDGEINETRFDEVISGLESLADVLDIYLEATDDRTTVRDLASLKLYAPPVSFEMWSSAFRKFFNFDFAELNTTIIYDVRSFSAIFRHVLVYGEAIMKDAFGFLSIMAAVWYTRSEIRDEFFGSPMDASFHQKQYCSFSLYEFYGDALNHFFFEKARSELKMFEGLQALMWNEFPRIVGPNGTLVGEKEPLPRANHLHGVSEFLHKSEPKVFLPRYKSYPNLTNSPLRKWIALTDNKRKQLGFDYNDSYIRQKHTSCASQCDATIFKWRLTPYHLTFPWYSSGIHRSILFAGLATRIAAAIFLDYVDRNELQRERLFEENQKCLQSMNPDLDEAPDVRLQAGVVAVLASSALLSRTSTSNSSLIGSGTYSLDGVGDVKESEAFFVFGCHLLCGDEDAERLCNLPLRHSFQFAHAFNCEVDTNMNPRRKCRLHV